MIGLAGGSCETHGVGFGRVEATFTDVDVIGMLPEGLRIDAHYTGSMIAGPLAGAIVRGVDYLDPV